MNRSEYNAHSMSLGAVDLMAAVTGDGAAAPVVSDATVMTVADNFAASASRTSAGLYVITLKEKVPLILQVVPTIERASGDLKHVNVASWSETDGTITVQVSKADGSAADDLEATDVLRLRIYARLYRA